MHQNRVVSFILQKQTENGKLTWYTGATSIHVTPLCAKYDLNKGYLKACNLRKGWEGEKIYLQELTAICFF